MKPANESESPQETPATQNRPEPKAEAAAELELGALRKRVAAFKEQARVLLERFEHGEISAAEAHSEAERLGREVSEAERQAGQWGEDR